MFTTLGEILLRNLDIKQRAYDGRWVVWAEVDNPAVDRDWYIKNNLGVPQIWIILNVTHTREAAWRSIKPQN